ncbi:WD repeat-containing protein 92 [Eumeta japonica]|uniref:WD repeat-containing protein 92 n=1 Tax=Eumeta variegata TaxID=151549 RepID=A0A4C1SNU9_EUMVA|nr:WD repeat-containing protein 92 [Eumeta japonica]
MDKPQMIEHLHQSVNYTVYDTKWIPCSAKFVVLGSKPNHEGILEIYELNESKVEKVKTIEKKSSFKCGLGYKTGLCSSSGHDSEAAQDKSSSINNRRDCWAVAIGDSFSNEEHIVAAGYDNGDIKLLIYGNFL